MLLTVSEAAELKKTTRFSIHRWIKSGLPFKWVEGKRMIDKTDLVSFRPREVGNPTFGQRKS